MAFTRKRATKASYNNPEALFHDLRSRTVEGLLSHQADILREYHTKALNQADVAIELPTGSGKTLVGLLIAEFRRVSRNERVLYLCPTKQLVRQTVEQSEKKYGIKATAFTGPSRDYDPSDKSRFQAAQTVAVAPYSALFNTNPFFSSPQLIILDDAHAAENYIASAWSLDIQRSAHKTLYGALLELLKPHLIPHIAARFIDDTTQPADAGWIEKIPSPSVMDLQTNLNAILVTHTADNDLKYPWQFLQGHLDTCHIYISHGSILIRPYIPPTMTHQPFAVANQRVYMSATLGRGGDLERITGVRNLHRLPIPKGWDKQGIGRRFFLFPEQSLKAEEVTNLLPCLMKQAGRSLMLTPSDKVAETCRQMVKDKLHYRVFGAHDIESSKAEFISTPNAVAILANRYDGIDLIGDDCRLLVIQGLPRATNLQEQFLMARMAAGNLLDDRIRTRIVQAVGRCTRSATDYAAVCVLGNDFDDWLVLNEKRSLFHPELQGELQFGLNQSIEKTPEDYEENLKIFLKQGEQWDEVDAEIVELRDAATQAPIRGEKALMASADREVQYTYALWNHDYESALDFAQRIAADLSGGETKGFRGFWYYLAGAAAEQLSRQVGSGPHLRDVAADQFNKAAACAPALPWLRTLISSAMDVRDPQASLAEECLQANVTHLDALFEKAGFSSPRKFEREAKAILDGLERSEAMQFEEAHRRLGSLLGFESGNSDDTAAPDPWWVSAGKICIVSEDKSDSQPNNPVSVKHVRQAVGHPKLVLDHVKLAVNPKIACILITPATTIQSEAASLADDLFYWQINEFRQWANNAIATIRTLRNEYPGPGNLGWRDAASKRLQNEKLDPMSILQHAMKFKLKDLSVHKNNGSIP
ncbi:MAG: DEAD/DEAH box helicase [Phycisphaerales bacterium]|jgi:hypothetical protein|nr:DEAD/DEAH box helicase [Phycisphaerales bacterium]